MEALRTARDLAVGGEVVAAATDERAGDDTSGESTKVPGRRGTRWDDDALVEGWCRSG